ncbi:MAG: hypothetical protein WBB01_15335 [Phormidesmis sp.]
MSRESCITHQPKQAIAIVRQDYYDLMDKDACAAALLNVFEYWANAAISTNFAVERPWIGARPIREFEQMLLGIATDKQIRKRLALLEARGFIQSKGPAKRGAAKEYQVLIPEIQRALVGQMTSQETALRSNNLQSFGQMTDDKEVLRSFDQPTLGQMTSAPSVKQPTTLRSNDRALKKESKEFKKEGLKEAQFALSESSQGSSEQSPAELAERRSPLQIGVVQYIQQPETIDLSELWERNPGMVKDQIRFLAPGHKRPEMVAHGFGRWWVGPGLNDFDHFLIKACQKRKQKLEQSDGVGDAKTYINNMLKSGDWGNFALRCEEAAELRDRALAVQVATAEASRQAQDSVVPAMNALERAEVEQREAAIGLAKFKINQGELSRAKEIADQLGLSYLDIGLTADGERPDITSIPQAS